MAMAGLRLVLFFFFIHVKVVLADTIDVASTIVLLSYVGVCALGYVGLLIFCAWKCVRRRPAQSISYSRIDSPPSNAYSVSVVPTEQIKPQASSPPNPGGFFPPSGILPTDDQYHSPKYERLQEDDVPNDVTDHSSIATESAYDVPIQVSLPVNAESVSPTVASSAVPVTATSISIVIPEVNSAASSVPPTNSSPPPSYESHIPMAAEPVSQPIDIASGTLTATASPVQDVPTTTSILIPEVKPADSSVFPTNNSPPHSYESHNPISTEPAADFPIQVSLPVNAEITSPPAVASTVHPTPASIAIPDVKPDTSSVSPTNNSPPPSYEDIYK